MVNTLRRNGYPHRFISRVGFKPPTSLQDILMNVKDPVPMISRSDVVYRIPCGECTNSYIGQTKQSMGCRIKEHQRATFEGNKNASALAEHSMDTGHKISWDEAEILYSCNHLRARIMLESWIHTQREGCLKQGAWPSTFHLLSIVTVNL